MITVFDSKHFCSVVHLCQVEWKNKKCYHPYESRRLLNIYKHCFTDNDRGALALQKNVWSGKVSLLLADTLDADIVVSQFAESLSQLISIYYHSEL